MTSTAVAEPISETAPNVIARIGIGALYESRHNPRQRYDDAALEQLADSLLQTGQLTPIIVRQRREGGYEIAAGHRRYRAAKIAAQKSPEGARHRGLEALEAKIVKLDDRAFIEVLNVENLQRDDLHPLEEAQGFRDLMTQAGYDVTKIAARVGRSPQYVYDRIKLLQLTPAAKKLFLAGAFEAGHAIILARLTPEQQARALGDVNEVANGDYSLLLRPDSAAEDQDELPLHDRVKPVSVREFQKAIQREIRATPEGVDPFLFPESAKALEAAKEETLSVIHITREYLASDEVRRADEKQRVFGSQAWRRADGGVEEDERTGKLVKSKPCDWSRYGFVASGPGQGEVFKVCINKQKCKVHWPEHVKRAEEAKKRAKQQSTPRAEKTAEAQERAAAREAERERKEAEARKRRDDALPVVLTELADSMLAAIAKRAKAFAQVPDDVMSVLGDAEIYISNHKGARQYGDRVERFIAPQLPGKWQKATQWDPPRPLDAKAERQWFGMALYLALDAGKLDATITKQIDVTVKAAEKAGALVHKLHPKKPATKKSKKGARK